MNFDHQSFNGTISIKFSQPCPVLFSFHEFRRFLDSNQGRKLSFIPVPFNIRDAGTCRDMEICPDYVFACFCQKICIPTNGGRIWPPHYTNPPLPLPNFQTFLRPCRIVQESVVVETKNLLHHFSVFLADHWSTWVAPVPFSKDWRKRQLVLKSCHLLFILLGANLCLVKLEASLEVSFSKLLFTPHSQKKGPN